MYGGLQQKMKLMNKTEIVEAISGIPIVPPAEKRDFLGLQILCLRQEKGLEEVSFKLITALSFTDSAS